MTQFIFVFELRIINQVPYGTQFQFLYVVIYFPNFLLLQGENVRSLDMIGETAKAFTGERVWFLSTADIFHGTSTEEAFLRYTVIVPNSKNYIVQLSCLMYPAIRWSKLHW